MQLEDKLAILADSAKYDVACTSSGVDRAGVHGKLGCSAAAGICHAFTADGRCVSLLKVLYSNVCSYDCSYCVNRRSNDRPRATFIPRELAELTIGFYRRNYIEGLFLSSAVLDTPDRATLYAVQTPQCFRRALYTQALAAVTGEKASLVTDDCSLFELAGLPVRLTEGDYANYKITTKEDLQKEKTMRIGHGYDVHRLVEDRKLIMGGVEIPYEKGLLGHSDADVLLHAVMDAVLGAAALGDIGQHFPDNDPAYKGADSLALTREVARIIAEHGYKVGNIDATILCQRPKLAPHIPAMRRNIADAFGLPVDAVSVKATTEEHLGFTGEGLGIAAHAVALIE